MDTVNKVANKDIKLRDLRIDLFRGLALYMIFVGHVRGNIGINLSYRNLGFSDESDVFVFLSGISSGIAYWRLFARSGRDALLKRVAHRGFRTYVYYVLTCVASILVVTVSTHWVPSEDLNKIGTNFSAISQDPLGAIWMALCLIAPSFVGVLVLYLPLMIIVTPLCIMGMRWSAEVTLVASALLWLTVQIFPQLAPPEFIYVNVDSFFNPFAWQFLFVLGMYIGVGYSLPRSRLQQLQESKWFYWLLSIAWAIVAVSFAYRLVVHFFPRLDIDMDRIRITADTLAIMKQNLSPIRLIHLLSFALLIVTYLPSNSPIIRSPIFKPAITTGAFPLEVFCISTVLTYVTAIVFFIQIPPIPIQIALDLVAFTIMTATAFAYSQNRATQQTAARNLLENER